MKKVIFLILSFFILSKVGYAISASGYVVMDMDSQEVLMGSNIHEPRLIASITKIMTCIIAIENGDLNKAITVDESILKAFGSSIYLEVGEKITLIDLLYGMMLRSGNDAATMIAISISGSMEDFSKIMNKKAEELGMHDTYFYNSHGLEEDSGQGNKSTSYDMALLTSYAYHNDDFRKIFGTKKYTCKSDKKTYTWENKNKLLRYDYVTGGKTGFTEKARRTLVTTGSLDGKNIVIVTLNDGNDWNDHLSLYEEVRNNYTSLLVLDKDNFKIVDDTVYIEDKLYIKDSYKVTIKNEEIRNLKIKYTLQSKSNYKDNTKVGVASIYNGEKLLHSEDIYIDTKETKKGSKIINWFKKIFS